jgi:hypothetical protein
MTQHQIQRKLDMGETERKGSILAALTTHIGEPNAIGMGELYEQVYGEAWTHRINDTRALRKAITELREEGVPVCSVATSHGGGYYLAAAGSELSGYMRRNERQALRKLMRNAKMKKISLPDYLGQMRLNMEAVGDGKEAA